MVAIPVLLLGALGTTTLIRQVCVKKATPVQPATPVKIVIPVKMSKARARALARANAKRGKKRR